MKSYMAPQVCPTQENPPQTSVDARINAVKYTANSSIRGSIRRGSEGYTVGDASREMGCVIKSKSVGRTKMAEDKDNCTLNARVRRAAELRPVCSQSHAYCSPARSKYSTHLRMRTSRLIDAGNFLLKMWTMPVWGGRDMD